MQLWSDNSAFCLSPVKSQSRLVAVTLGYVIGLYVAWIGAWKLMFLLTEYVNWPASSDARVLYWTLMKVILWIIPAAFILRYSEMSVSRVLKGNGSRSILLWGGTSLLLGVEVVVRKFVEHQPYTLTFSWPLVSTVLISPFVEEFVFRGVVLGSLSKRYHFIWANVLASLLFVGAHLPGWYFTGTMVENLTKPIGGAFSIFLLGLYCGYIVLRSRSVMAGVIAHAINNFFSVL